MSLPKQLTDKQRIEFTKQLETFYEMSHPKWGRLISFSLVKGLATGFGIFLGGTIVVGLLLWLLSGLQHVPFLQDFTESVKSTIQQGGD